MAKMSKGTGLSSYVPKKTKQGNGIFTKTPHGGGETFYNNKRSGSPPSRAHRRKKPYRGQGR